MFMLPVIYVNVSGDTVVLPDSQLATWLIDGHNTGNTLNSKMDLPGDTGYLFNLTIDRTEESGCWDGMGIGQWTGITLQDGDTWVITVYNPHTNLYPIWVQPCYLDRKWDFHAEWQTDWIHPGQSLMMSLTVEPGCAPLKFLGLHVACDEWTRAPDVYTFDLIVTAPEEVVTYIEQDPDLVDIMNSQTSNSIALIDRNPFDSDAVGADTIVLPVSQLAGWTDRDWKEGNSLNSRTPLAGDTGYLYNLTIDRSAEAGAWDDIGIGLWENVTLQDGDTWEVTVHNPPQNFSPFCVQPYYYDQKWVFHESGRPRWIYPGKTMMMSITVEAGHAPLNSLGLHVVSEGWTGATEVYTFDLMVVDPEAVKSYIQQNPGSAGMFENFEATLTGYHKSFDPKTMDIDTTFYAIKANHLILKNDMAEADESIHRIFARYPADPTIANVLCGLAARYHQQRDFDNAIQWYQRVLDGSPEPKYQLMAYSGLAQGYIGLGDIPQAREKINRMLTDFSENPRIVDALVVIGHVFAYEAARKKSLQQDEDQGRQLLEEAVALVDWKEILDRYPDEVGIAKTYHIVGNWHKALGQHKKAVEYYKLLCNKKPNYQRIGLVQFMIGNCYKELKYSGEVDMAEADIQIFQSYNQALNLLDNPNTPAADTMRAWLKDYSEK